MMKLKEYKYSSNEEALKVLEDFASVPGGKAWDTVDTIDQAITNYINELIDIMSKMGIYGNPTDIHEKSNNSDFYDMSSDIKALFHQKFCNATTLVDEATHIIQHLIFELGGLVKDVTEALKEGDIIAEWEATTEPTKGWQKVLKDEQLQRDIAKMEYNL